MNLRKSSYNDALNAVDEYIRVNNLAVPNKIHPNNKLMYVSKFKGIPVTSSIVNSPWTKGESLNYSSANKGSASKEYGSASKGDYASGVSGSGSKANNINNFSISNSANK